MSDSDVSESRGIYFVKYYGYGEGMAAGEKNKHEDLGGEKCPWGKKGDKLHKNGEKGLKDASFLVINSKKSWGRESSDPPYTLHPWRAIGKKNLKGGFGGEECSKAQYISLNN